MLNSGFAGLCMLRCLIGGGCEKSISFSAPAAAGENVFLAFVVYFAKNFSCFCIFCNGTEGYINDFVFSISAGHVGFAAAFAVCCSNVLAIFQMKQRPHLAIASQNNVTSTAAIASIRSTLLNKLFAMKMKTTRTSMTRARIELYIINEIG